MSTQNPNEKEHPCFIETNKNNAMLAVITSTGQRYQLPYFHFLAGCLEREPNSKTETYHLEFALHIVLITGENLSALAKGVECMRVRVVRPQKKEATVTDVRISRIEVALRNAGDE